MSYWRKIGRIGAVVQTPTGPTHISERPGADIRRIGSGDQLAIDVAHAVRRCAIAAQFDPRAVDLARRVVTTTPARDPDSYARAIRACLGRHFLYADDPRDTEAIASVGDMADAILTEGATRGDCEEAAALGAGLGLCVGLTPRLVLEAHWSPVEPFEHIYTELAGQSGWWDLNVTAPPGKLPPVGRQLIVDI